MLQLGLTHLTFLGQSVEPASVTFGPRLTVVRGPSDTGKSFIVDAIDFVLGASALKEIPERNGYSSVLLGLVLPDGTKVTLTRSVAGGAIGLYNEDKRTGPFGPPDETLAAKHNPRAAGNVSRFLLGQIGMEGRRVRKNAQNQTDSLSFRNLAHLCIVDETQMQSETPPALTGSYVSRTKEVSVLKLLLQDEDDSALVAVDSKQERTRLGAAKLEVLDRLLAQNAERLAEVPEERELRDQHARLTTSVQEHSRSVASLISSRDAVAQRLRTLQGEEAERRNALGDARALLGRLTLLLDQYNSDLDRIDMIREAGNLLGFFRAGVCVFCGADPEDQHFNEGCEGDATSLGESVAAEAEKTAVLRDDLQATLEDLTAEIGELDTAARSARAKWQDLQQELDGLDERIRPVAGDLEELLAARAAIERSLTLYEQMQSLQELRSQIAAESRASTAAVTAALDLGALREFSAELSQRLEDWHFPDASAVRYDRGEQDIIAGDQLRSAHGKGVRAILHAAFTVGLAQYCFDRDIAHPGFVILDSPLVTYRPPDARESPSRHEEDHLPEDFAAAFYDDLQRRFDGQVIVMENTDPPQALLAESVDVSFSKVSGLGRYGFFPHTDESTPKATDRR